ncbi:MAG TPA: hypothetical protein VGS19_30755 [Streptosporangiaceae bacterium]|nr:hypothetical protein [Streptosporangiaceae bacterium]
MDVHVRPTATPSGPVIDVDALARGLLDGEAGEATVPAVLAVAAIATWRGATTVSTRHAQQVQRAVDMAATIAGTRLPCLTVRGLA